MPRDWRQSSVEWCRDQVWREEKVFGFGQGWWWSDRLGALGRSVAGTQPSTERIEHGPREAKTQESGQATSGDVT